jgi:hypothetical protein
MIMTRPSFTVITSPPRGRDPQVNRHSAFPVSAHEMTQRPTPASKASTRLVPCPRQLLAALPPTRTRRTEWNRPHSHAACSTTRG